MVGLGALMAAGAARAHPTAPIAPTGETSLRPRLRPGSAKPVVTEGAEALIARSGLSGQVVCAVADVKSGLGLEAVNGDVGMPPASVSKALTALYALDVLGPEYRFNTRLIAGGEVRNGVLRGDLILAGGGDPTLTTDNLATLAATLKAAGIREVRGAFKVYDAMLPYVRSIDAGQPDDAGYNTSVSGIALNFNRVYFQWKRSASGYDVTMDARTNKFRPQVQSATMRVVDRQLPIYTYASRNGADQWSVAKRALGKGGGRWLPVRNPALYAGDVFRTLARANGIVLRKPKAVRNLGRGGQVVASHSSVKLRTILKGMLRFSNNMTAEMIGLTASTARGGKPGSLKASASEMNWWAEQKYAMSDMRLVDHSGLGGNSTMTARDMVGALVKVRNTGVLRPMLKRFPLRDADGKEIRSHPIKVNAKTGTLDFVSALAGFMTAPDGTELAFAIFSADTVKRARGKNEGLAKPRGARSWNKTAKKVQQELIERWGALYG